MKYTALLIFFLNLSACAVLPPVFDKGSTVDSIIPRYISPLKYQGYSCRSLNLAYNELISIELKLSDLLSLHGEDSRTVIVSKWDAKNKIKDNKMSEKIYLSFPSLSLVKGHIQGIEHYAITSSCSLTL